MIQLLDQLVDRYFDYVEIVGLLAIMVLALRLRSVVAFIVLADFTLVYFGQNWLRSLSIWGSLGLDYHYVLGIKDTLLALSLFLLAASPWLTMAYIIPALLCWVVWGSYSLFEYETFLKFYYAWSPLYAMAMFLQIFGLTRGDSDVGKRARAGLIPLNWDRIVQPLNRVAYARIAVPYFKAKEV